MCQVEFALTQIVVRPVHGRTFFEEVLRENLDVAERSIIDPFSQGLRTRFLRDLGQYS